MPLESADHGFLWDMWESATAVVQMAADMLHKKGYMAIVELLDRAHKRSTADANTDEEESVSS